VLLTLFFGYVARKKIVSEMICHVSGETQTLLIRYMFSNLKQSNGHIVSLHWVIIRKWLHSISNYMDSSFHYMDMLCYLPQLPYLWGMTDIVIMAACCIYYMHILFVPF